jgi:hypothetical protein
MLLCSVIVVAGAVVTADPLHAVTNAYASTDPRPVTWSYPAAAGYPAVPAVQFLCRAEHVTVTMLSPVVMSWKTAGFV